MKTGAGKNIPVDVDGTSPDDQVFDSTRHVSHFKTCPNASSHSKKVEHVKAAGQARDHKCHWPDCEQNVPPAMWGCKRHWFALPKDIRDEIWRTYRPGQENDLRPSTSYFTAAKRAQDWIAQHEQGKVT